MRGGYFLCLSKTKLCPDKIAIDGGSVNAERFAGREEAKKATAWFSIRRREAHSSIRIVVVANPDYAPTGELLAPMALRNLIARMRFRPG